MDQKPVYNDHFSEFREKIGLKNINTVKLGYNELGYNEHPVITNKINTDGWFQSI